MLTSIAHSHPYEVSTQRAIPSDAPRLSDVFQLEPYFSLF